MDFPVKKIPAMNIADSIIEAMETRKKSGFPALRSKIKGSRQLSKADFKRLATLLGTEALEILSIPDLTVGECHLIGKALHGAKLQDTERVIDCVITKQNKRAAGLLTSILNKGSKIDLSSCLLREYIRNLLLDDISLCHLKLLSTISKNYPNLIDREILDFCTRNSHPICKMILEKHDIVCE